MIFTETALTGAFVIDIERRDDERGFFARTFCQREFATHGLSATIVEASIAHNHHKGAIRGLHFQYPPVAQAKLVRCERGAILDVVVDLRPESPTYLRHALVELTASSRRGLWVPERFAHGYQVLEDDSDVTYQMSEFYSPGAEGGLGYDDPHLAITWALPVAHVSVRDRGWRPLALIEPDLRRRMTIPTGVGAR